MIFFKSIIILILSQALLCSSLVVPKLQRRVNSIRSSKVVGSDVARKQNAHKGRPRGELKAMFSGIVEEKGEVKEVNVFKGKTLWDGTVGDSVELIIEAAAASQDAVLGSSIAVNGVCLTVVEFNSEAKWFKVGLAPETLRLSNLKDLKPKDKVNVERALSGSSRNSGHFVQGHVDCTGEIIKTKPEGDSQWYFVKVPNHIMKYIVPKGFIAVDGTSLTVCEVNSEESWFSFMLVAYTQQHIIIPSKNVGDQVNIEVDVLGKYASNSTERLSERVAELELKVASLSKQLKNPSPQVEDKLGELEHKIKNRDLIIRYLEEQVAELAESIKKK